MICAVQMRGLFAIILLLAITSAGAAHADALDAWCTQVRLASSVVTCSDPELRAEAIRRQRLFEIAQGKLSAARYLALREDQTRWIRAYTARCGVSVEGPTPASIPPQVVDCYKRESRLRNAFLAIRLGEPGMKPPPVAISLPPAAILPPGGLNFACGRTGCRCFDLDDCIDLLVNTNFCDPTYIECTYDGDDSRCYCHRR